MNVMKAAEKVAAAQALVKAAHKLAAANSGLNRWDDVIAHYREELDKAVAYKAQHEHEWKAEQEQAQAEFDALIATQAQ